MSGFIVAKFDRVRLFTKLWYRLHPALPFVQTAVVGYNPHGRVCIYWPNEPLRHMWLDADEFDKLNLLMMV